MPKSVPEKGSEQGTEERGVKREVKTETLQAETMNLFATPVIRSSLERSFTADEVAFFSSSFSSRLKRSQTIRRKTNRSSLRLRWRQSMLVFSRV